MVGWRGIWGHAIWPMDYGSDWWSWFDGWRKILAVEVAEQECSSGQQGLLSLQ